MSRNIYRSDGEEQNCPVNQKLLQIFSGHSYHVLFFCFLTVRTIPAIDYHLRLNMEHWLWQSSGVNRADKSSTIFPIGVTEQAWPWLLCELEQISPYRILKIVGYLKFPSKHWDQCYPWSCRGFSRPRMPAQWQHWTLGNFRLSAWNNIMWEKSLWTHIVMLCVVSKSWSFIIALLAHKVS